MERGRAVALPFTTFLRQLGRRHLAVGNIVVDPTSLEPLALAMPLDNADRTNPLQFADDEIALRVGVVVGGVRHLKGEPRQGKARVARASANPERIGPRATAGRC